MPVRVLIVDDHPLFRDGLTNLLSSRGVEVVGTAQDGLEALERARALRPEVVLMDVQMPRMDGLAATRLIKAELPEITIVMLTMSGESEDLFEAIKGGATGYLLKTQDTEEFFCLLQGLARGEVPLSPGLAGRILREFATQSDEVRAVRAAARADEVEGLSARQMKVLTLVAQGMVYKEVAAELGFSERTVKYHMGEIVARLHLDNRAQAVEYARRMGWIGGR
jgi:DNA-binding NarL/FixJ family response regulator